MPRQGGAASPAHGWDRQDPRLDRAAGAWVGAAAAGWVVGAPPSVVADVAPANTTTDGAGPLGRLIVAALRQAGEANPAGRATAADGAAEEAFARVLRDTVAGGRPPHECAAVPGRGWLSAAWRAVAEAPVPVLDPARAVFPCAQWPEAVGRARAAHGDEAAMAAGALAGARWGVSGVPVAAQRGLSGAVARRRLVREAVLLTRGTAPGDWPEARRLPAGPSRHILRPFAVAHPHDPGVTLGNLSYLRSEPAVQAVVSLCRVGRDDVGAHLCASDRVEVWLDDSPHANPNLHFVVEEAAGAVAALRAEGKRVLLHCAAGQSRTPAVAAHYAARVFGVDVLRALRATIRAVGGHVGTPQLARAVAALHRVVLDDPRPGLFPQGVMGRRVTSGW